MASSVPEILSWLPPRPSDAHKNDFGHVLIVGGARGMMGAPRLAALGALRGGAGLVTMAVPESLEPIAALGPWEAMTLPLLEHSGGLSPKAVAVVRSYMERRHVTAVALGPGMGGEKETLSFVRSYLSSVSVPTVMDADGLNALASLGPRSTKAPLILTPHAGEMARLLGLSRDAVQKDRRAAVRAAAQRYKAIVVLKGHASLISDGEKVHLNSTGNPAMASAGMGDVLAGLIASLVGQLSEEDIPTRLWRAAVLGVTLHGHAGDAAVHDTHARAVLASEVAHRLSGRPFTP